mmetsp:Transcript_101339/g.226276  ORF Transcript_101339/g.226276 Transcript_101339/m.226276 type:complete len:199 (+) Transcript_101339:116-712(+)
MRLERVVALLAAIAAVQASSAKDSISAEVQSVEAKAKDEEEAVADAAEAYCAAHDGDPDGVICCKGSTCYWDDSYPAQKYMLKVPDVPCDKSRGNAKCEGGSLFPMPKAGICVCRTGHCINNKCQDKDGGLMGDLESDLFAITDADWAPKPASFPVVPWLLCLLLWASLVGTTLLVMRVIRSLLSRSSRGSEEQLYLE